MDSGVLSRSAVEKGGKSALSAMDVISSVRIPILSSDNDVIRFCKDYRLNEPQNIIRFFVESYYAQFSASIEAITNLQKENLDEVISKVDNARNYLLDALKQNNDTSKREMLRDSVRESRSAISNLQRKIENYISEVRRIDDLPDWKYKLQAPANLPKLKAQGVLAKAAAASLTQAINLLESASAELGETANMFTDCVREKFNTATTLEKRFHITILNITTAVKQFKLEPKKTDKRRYYFFQNDARINYLSEQLATIGEFGLTSRDSIYAKAKELQQTIHKMRSQGNNPEEQEKALKRINTLIKAYEEIVEGNYIDNLIKAQQEEKSAAKQASATTNHKHKR